MDKLLEKGFKYLKKEKYDKAINTFKKYLLENQGDILAFNYLVYSYNRQGLLIKERLLKYLMDEQVVNNFYDKAIYFSKYVLSKNPESELAMNNLFFAYSQMGDFDNSLKIIRDYLNNHPSLKNLNDLESKLREKNQSRISKDCERKNSIIDEYKKDKFYNPRTGWDLVYPYSETFIIVYNKEILFKLFLSNSIEFHLFTGFTYSNIIEKNDIIAIIKLILDYFPSHFYAWRYLASIFHEHEHYQEAIEAYKKALEINKSNELTWYKLGHAYYKDNQHNKAIESFNKILKINPKNIDALMYLGDLFGILEKYDKNIEYYKKALKFVSKAYNAAKNSNTAVLTNRLWYNYRDVLSKLGVAYSKKGDFENAIKYCNRAIEHSKRKNAEAWYYLGLVLFMKSDFNKAIKALKKAIDLNKDYNHAWSYLGLCYLYIEDFDNSTKACKRSIYISEKDYVAWYCLASVYFKRNKFAEALKACETALEINSKLSEVKELRDMIIEKGNKGL